MGIDEQNSAGPYAFLFDGSIDGLPDPQLPFFTAAVLAALSNADPAGRTRAQIRVGMPLLSKFAERTSAVRGFVRGSGRTLSHDKDVYKYTIWDWLDSLDQGWSSLNREQGHEIFRRHTGECIALSALHDSIRDTINAALKTVPGYIGSFAIDPGNPVHRTAFFDVLIYAAAAVGGGVVQERSFEGDEDWPLAGATEFRPKGLLWKEYGWLASKGPKGLPKVHLSERGLRAAANIVQKQVHTVETRVIEEIASVFFEKGDGKIFEFQSIGEPSDVLQAIMPEGKFTKYLFDREHKDGRSKAAFLIDELGIEPEDWRYLAAQFYSGLLMARPEAVKLNHWDTGYGARFDVTMRVRSRSGSKAVVVTGWNMNPGKLPSLSTAFPGARNSEAVEPGDPPILRPGTGTNADWMQLWNWANRAGASAAGTVVPTPMFVVGYEPFSEGEIGTATVRVAPAQTGFARWLLQHGPGKRDDCGGSGCI
ncbi:hypothetical protein QO058_01555 [Bosea vestrisii]|uniref:DUF6883 domain-containing protein n=1 Tax=Bosea vestrisii TaxID=151416 RepID=UPI0024DFB2F2|nr:DUF6883 domain-containing protein [Bosea vestrisii]WID96998.1 hypothetical protein QO058_01555 [Bosea vestrisii]